MGVLAILLYIMAGINIIRVFAYSLVNKISDEAWAATYPTPKPTALAVAWKSFVAMTAAVILILAGLGLSGAFAP